MTTTEPPATWPRAGRVFLTGDDRTQAGDRIAELYNSGMSVRAVAAETGLSYGVVQRMIHERDDVTVRTRGGKAPAGTAATA